MKIKMDFVTNSSSTSYIIGVKKLDETDDVISAIPPVFRRMIEQGMNIFTKGKKVTSKIELLAHLKEEYYYTPGDTDQEWVEKLYVKIDKALTDGYHVYFNEVDNNELTMQDMFESLPEDDGDAVYMIDHEGM